MLTVSVNDLGTTIPIGGVAALFIVMLRMVWADNAARRLIEGRLRAEWAADREQLIRYHEAALDRLRADYEAQILALKRLHDSEVISTDRRIANLEANIRALEADIVRLKAQT